MIPDRVLETTNQMSSSRNDDLYMELVRRHQIRGEGLDELLLGLFAFMHSRTDLYVVAESKQLGFSAGVAEQKVLRAFRTYPYKDLNTGEGGKFAKEGGEKEMRTKKEDVKQKVEGMADKQRVSDRGLKQNIEGEPNVNDAVQNSSKEMKPIVSESDAMQNVKNEVKTIVSGKDTRQSANNKLNESGDTVLNKYPTQTIPTTTAGLQIPIGNGGSGPNYKWTQTMNDITIYLDAPLGTRGKNVTCDVKFASIYCALKTFNGTTLLSGNFPANETVDVKETVWTLDDDGCIVIVLAKKRETWWTCVVQGHLEIDTSLVDSTRKISEYDNATQGSIRKVMHEKGLKESALTML